MSRPTKKRTSRRLSAVTLLKIEAMNCLNLPFSFTLRILLAFELFLYRELQLKPLELFEGLVGSFDALEIVDVVVGEILHRGEIAVEHTTSHVEVASVTSVFSPFVVEVLECLNQRLDGLNHAVNIEIHELLQILMRCVVHEQVGSSFLTLVFLQVLGGGVFDSKGFHCGDFLGSTID